MAKRTRLELKKLFKTGARPTELDFIDVFDSLLNVQDDKIEKQPDASQPLKIIASGEQQNIFDFYDQQGSHNWRINQYPDSSQGKQFAGFNIEDGQAQTRFFIEQDNGHIGLATTYPKARLHVVMESSSGDVFRIDDAGINAAGDNDATPFVIKNNGDVAIGAEESQGAKLYLNGSLQVVNEEKQATWFHINEDGAIAVNGKATKAEPHVDINGDVEVNGKIVGDGSQVTNLNASNLSDGTIPYNVLENSGLITKQEVGDLVFWYGAKYGLPKPDYYWPCDGSIIDHERAHPKLKGKRAPDTRGSVIANTDSTHKNNDKHGRQNVYLSSSNLPKVKRSVTTGKLTPSGSISIDYGYATKANAYVWTMKDTSGKYIEEGDDKGGDGYYYAMQSGRHPGTDSTWHSHSGSFTGSEGSVSGQTCNLNPGDQTSVDLYQPTIYCEEYIVIY
ncbi:hypothetical protein KCM76_05650 [Zooshikella marina]|uniref:hypothetical protein n=1 Tax=Zooshikella ganghwensis TaxID=202772 RepID=UPI001BAF7C88|nr:hypothetical protein [Zooshikella ganghwensis]MBU2705453.1 hypothetical protein [Zooshikella ganghwensis]